MNILFSIIIPVYNVEDYLCRCIDSVINQSFENWEIVLVDDGSSDRCGVICDEYARRDNRINVIHSSNGGLSRARNHGLDYLLRGDYVLFIDSDDYWDNPNGLLEIAKRIISFHEDVVLFEGRTQDCFSGERRLYRGAYKLDHMENKTKHEVINYLVKEGNFPGSAWIYTVKRELLEKYKIRFPVDVTAEDFYWNSTVFYYAESIGAVNNNLYVYIVNRPGSITSKAKLSGVKGIHIAITQWYMKSDWNQCVGITQYLAYAFLIALYNYGKLNEEERGTCKKLLKADSCVLKDAKRPLFYSILLILKCVGYGAVACLLDFIHKCRR